MNQSVLRPAREDYEACKGLRETAKSHTGPAGGGKARGKKDDDVIDAEFEVKE